MKKTTFCLFLIILCSIAYSQEVSSPEDEERTVQEKMKDISKKMEEMASHLRDDRHDTTVEIAGKEIIKDLNSLISEVEISEKSKMSSNPKKEIKNYLDSSGSSGSRGQKSELSQSNPIPKALPPLKTMKNTWAQLPPTERETILQLWGSDIPLRWKQRVEAYFISVAAEEIKDKNKR